MPWISSSRGLALLCLLASAGCAGNGHGLDQNGRPTGSESGSTGPLTADLQSIQDNIFTPICTRCHIGASAEEPTLLRVSPGNPDASYLIRKLEGGPGIVGVQMPFGGPYLPQATIDVIRQWITNGAQQAASVNVAEQNRALAVTGTSPMDGATVMAPVKQILIAFNHDIDATLVNETTVMLERVLPCDATFAVARAKLVPANGAVIIVESPAGFSPGTYRVKLRGTGGAALADLNAATLGADYVFTFTVGAAQ